MWKIVSKAKSACCRSRWIFDADIDVKKNRLYRGMTGLLLPLLSSACTIVNGGTEEASAVREPPPAVGIAWKLLRFDASSSADSFAIQLPANYTLALLADGSYRVKADCNRMQGTYRLDGQKLSIHPGAATLAECGPESRYAHYLTNLTTAKAVEIDANHHHLTLITDKGRLVFEKRSETP